MYTMMQAHTLVIIELLFWRCHSISQSVKNSKIQKILAAFLVTLNAFLGLVIPNQYYQNAMKVL